MDEENDKEIKCVPGKCLRVSGGPVADSAPNAGAQGSILVRKLASYILQVEFTPWLISPTQPNK